MGQNISRCLILIRPWFRPLSIVFRTWFSTDESQIFSIIIVISIATIWWFIMAVSQKLAISNPETKDAGDMMEHTL